jgi:hypothetical protein
MNILTDTTSKYWCMIVLQDYSTEIRIDNRSFDLKHGNLRTYHPTRASIKRYLRAIERRQHILVIHHDGYSISTDSTCVSNHQDVLINTR